jgi:hypothetical protein
MSKTMNNTLRVIVAVSICTGLYLGGIYIGDLRASARVRADLSAAHAEAMAAARSRLDAIDAILLGCETIHGDRGPDGVWTFALFRPDGTAWEVQGRTLEELIGGAQ